MSLFLESIQIYTILYVYQFWEPIASFYSCQWGLLFYIDGVARGQGPRDDRILTLPGQPGCPRPVFILLIIIIYLCFVDASLMDWSSTNDMAVALNTDVYTWHPVKKVCASIPLYGAGRRSGFYNRGRLGHVIALSGDWIGNGEIKVSASTRIKLYLKTI